MTRIRNIPSCVIGLAFLIGGVPAAAQPISPDSFRLREFAAELYSPSRQLVLQVIGDSINSPIAPSRMQIGYRDDLDIPWNGFVVQPDAGNADIGYTNAQSSPLVNVTREPGESATSGQRFFHVTSTRDAQWAPQTPADSLLVQTVLYTPNFTSFVHGNPFAGSVPISVRAILYEASNVYTGFDLIARRGFADESDRLVYLPSIPPSGQIAWADLTLPAVNALPILEFRSNSISFGAPPGRNGLTVLGVRFRAQTPAGVQLQFIAHAGWNTVDHLVTTRFTDQAITQFYQAAGTPTHIILWLGQNMHPGESGAMFGGDYGPYKNNLRALMNRHNAAAASLGTAPPRWLLVSQYQTGYDLPWLRRVALAQYELAQADPMVSTLNLYELAGADTFDKDRYLSDGIHPNVEGVHHLAALMNAEMTAALFECPADLNADGFVTGDDFDLFTGWFVAGTLEADFNADGFVTGDDFDAFATAFIAGC